MDRIQALAVLLAAMVVGLILYSLFTQGRWLEQAYHHLSDIGMQKAYSVEIAPVAQISSPSPIKQEPAKPLPPKKPQKRGRTLEQILANP